MEDKSLKPKQGNGSLILKKPVWAQYASFLVCVMIMLVYPIWKEHKIFGISLPDDEGETIETIRTTDTGYIINTTEIGKDIIGYVGTTPVEITVSGGKIQKIIPLPNRETPEFFGAIRNSNLFESLDGKSVEEGLNTKIDGVSGATYTSKAIIGNIKTGLAYALDEKNAKEIGQAADSEKLSLKWYITLIIIVAGGVIPFYIKDKRYRVLQLILNVVLLGFWGGTFISYSIMTSFATYGIKSVALLPVALMLIAAFIYPFIGKKDYYCLWMCPYGSAQELLGKCFKFKVKLKPNLIKWLNYFRQALWFVLMWLLWTGLWFDWMGYEPFAAFFFTDASVVTLSIAGAFLILSFIVQRPYCRFVCPTGSLFKYSEGNY